MEHLKETFMVNFNKPFTKVFLSVRISHLNVSYLKEPFYFRTVLDLQERKLISQSSHIPHTQFPHLLCDMSMVHMSQFINEY